jgi:PQQ-dependent catabolism-associated CXXCW motif protein
MKAVRRRLTQQLSFWVWVGVLMLSLGPTFAADEPEFDATTGYRISRYRTPVDPKVPGGTRVQIEQVDDLIRNGVILVDVLPSDGAGLDLKTGTWQMAKPHENIPGSTWLPDVGRGHIEPLIEQFFKSNLERLTGGDRSRSLLIYCQSDCWMGWNAVKRASSYGYSSLYWYADGIDGWRDFERPFSQSKPVPVMISDAASPKDNGASLDNGTSITGVPQP